MRCLLGGDKYSGKNKQTNQSYICKRIESAKRRGCYFTVKAREGLAGGGQGGPWGPCRKGIVSRGNSLCEGSEVTACLGGLHTSQVRIVVENQEKRRVTENEVQD